MARRKYYDRYQRMRVNGTFRMLPFIDIPEYTTDLYIIYDKATMRLDSLSYKYYGDANYAWLIMTANPSLGSLEYMIEDGVRMRIPYPLDLAINRYEQAINNYISSSPQ